MIARAALLLVWLSAAVAVAEPAVHTLPAFASRIQQVHATPAGAYLVAGNNQVWFVEPTGTARQVPIPLDGRIEHTDFEPAGGLLWGCTRTAVFATNAAGAWQSWGLAEDPARRNCFVAPSPGTTWIVAGTADERMIQTDVGAVNGGELTVELERRRGVHFSTIATDEAGGLWAVPTGLHSGIAHFDGASWRIWSPNRMSFVGTDYVDIFPFDQPIYAQALGADGTGGVIAATPTEFLFMRSTAPYPNIARVAVSQPGFGLPSHALGIGADRIWGVGRNDDAMVLASWDFSGRLVGAEQVPTPKWFDRDVVSGGSLVAAGAHGVWVAHGSVLFHRHPDGWSVFAASTAIDKIKRQKRRKSRTFWGALPLVTAGTVSTLLAPSLWGPELGVSYPRGAGETFAAMALGVVSPYVSIQNEVWRGDWRTPFMLTFGLLFSTGIATVATLTPEAAIVGEDEPFPIGGAVLGGAIGYTSGALVDLLMHALDVESAFGRAVLWSSFTAIGAPLGFHALRGPLGAE